MRNFLEQIRKRDDQQVKADTQEVYLAGGPKGDAGSFPSLWIPVKSTVPVYGVTPGARQ